MLGVEIVVENGFIKVSVKWFKGGYFIFDMVSVIGIENVLMGVVLVEGIIVFDNCVMELEVIDLVYCLIVLGVKIEGLGIVCLVIEGVECLFGGCYEVLFDCIEIGIFLVVVVMIGGKVMVNCVCLNIMDVVLFKLVEVGVKIEIIEDIIILDM